MRITGAKQHVLDAARMRLYTFALHDALL